MIRDVFTAERLDYYAKIYPRYTYEKQNKITKSIYKNCYYGIDKDKTIIRMWTDCELCGLPFSRYTYEEVMKMKKGEVVKFSTMLYNYTITCKR